MRIIDRKWINLAEGFQAIQSLQAKLEVEFGRAVQAGHKQKFRKELTEWQKKRRVFFTLVAIAPLSIITLCLAAYYSRDVACVIVYWAVVVLFILVTLAVAGRSYIREVMNRPEPEHAKTLAVDLEQRWWASLAPKEQAVAPAGNKKKADFLTLLDQTLPDTCLARRDLLVDGDADTLLLSPSGLWLFTVRDWSGSIVKQDGVWKQILKRREEKVHEAGPDDQWLKQKEEIVKILEKRLPQRAWTGSLIQGGVTFTHPKATLNKSRIQDNTAAYGPAKAWAERLRRAPSVDDFTLNMMLEILDVLTAGGNLNEQPGEKPVSAKDEAERLYQEAADELRQSVAKMMK